MEGWASSYSLAAGACLAALAVAMPSDAFRAWRKEAFQPWGFAQNLEYYLGFVIAPLWLAVFGAACLALVKPGRDGPKDFAVLRRWLPSGAGGLSVDVSSHDVRLHSTAVQPYP